MACQQAVERASGSTQAGVDHVGVDHRRRQVLVAQKLLHSSDVGTVLEEMGGEGVTKSVGADALTEARPSCRLGDFALKDGFMQVVTAILAVIRAVRAGRGEHPLPDPASVGARELLCEVIGERDVARTFLEVALVLTTHDLQMTPEVLEYGLREERESVAAALAVADHHLAAVEVDVLNPELSALEQAKARPVQDERHQTGHAR